VEITTTESTLNVITELAKTDERGARFDKVIDALEKQGLTRRQIDEAVMELLDYDQITEEKIGWLKPKKTGGLFDW
jgi:DNA replicative helicase MCM subunit Mcm2 (Cdc46/Mcm family)